MASSLSETIVALATPPGTSALGVLRVSGSQSIHLAARLLDRPALTEAPGHTAHFGRIRDESGRLLDEVVVVVYRAPRSFTGEDSIEISCHGSPYILQEVMSLLLRQGCRMANPGEFSLRAFLNGKMDLTQAEAIADLIASGNEKAHELAMKQLRGGIAAWIGELRQRLIKFASLIELELDFSEEDVTFADRKALRELIDDMEQQIRPLIESFRYGNAIRQGVSTVLAGRPNAGKSTLLNALLNEERAIVSDIAGTTRDTIEEDLVIEGIPFRLIDTAGIREAVDQIESIGIRRTMEKIEQSSLLLYIFDVISTEPAALWEDLSRLHRPGLQVLVVANKMDLNPYTEPGDYVHDTWLPASHLIMASAIHQMNISYLKEKMVETVLGSRLNEAAAIVQNARHVEALEATIRSLGDARAGLDTGVSGEFVAMDIRQALHHLGSITGEISSEDLLDSIFRDFCIGK